MYCVVTETLSKELEDALFHWGPDPFQSKQWGTTWRSQDHHIVFYEDDLPLSHVGLVRQAITINQEVLMIGGLGGVITVPGHQGRGLAKIAIREADRIIVDEWDVNYGLLFCFPHMRQFYERLGWTERKEKVWFSQPNGRTAAPFHSMVKSWNGFDWPDGEIEIPTLPW